MIFAKISQKEDKVRQKKHLKRSTTIDNVRQTCGELVESIGTKFMQNKANLCKAKLP
jgi:hypothetical protein